MAASIMTLANLIFSIFLLSANAARIFDRRSDAAGLLPITTLNWELPLEGGQVCVDNTDCDPTLSAPAANKTLRLLALGRGTFNYSCDDAQPANAPVFVEQFTELYDASILIPPGVDDTFFHNLVQELHNYDYVDLKNGSLDCIGSIGTLDSAAVVTLYEIDTFEAVLEERIPAPEHPDVNGVWAHSRSQDDEWEMYRVQMVGGAIPSTCRGIETSFDVEYAAEYWFYHAE